MADIPNYPGLEAKLKEFTDFHKFSGIGSASAFVLGYKAALDYIEEQKELQFQKILQESADELIKTMDGDDVDLQF